MRANRRYLVAMALLAVLAVGFGLLGTVAPAFEPVAPQTEMSSSSSSSDSNATGHFQNPPSYDSGWVDITAKTGQYITLRHGLNTTEVIVDITGKQSLEPYGGAMQWSKTYGGTINDYALSVIQTRDGGYALAGYTNSYGAGSWDMWLVKTDSAGAMTWSRTYGGAGGEAAYSVVHTSDGGYVLAGVGSGDFWLVKTDVENGLARTGLTNNSITLYRGLTDPYWNYVRVRIWTIKEPSWIYGDLNMDGIVDAKDPYILSRNYGKTLSLLSLSGIITLAGIHTIKKRKQQSK